MTVKQYRIAWNKKLPYHEITVPKGSRILGFRYDDISGTGILSFDVLVSAFAAGDPETHAQAIGETTIGLCLVAPGTSFGLRLQTLDNYRYHGYFTPVRGTDIHVFEAI
jgi:hypothetical protein